ncbi:MAG: hypothetical protein R3A47_09765 [Polyangiales bacterium]
MLYSLLQLVELRFSPQLHRWIYGYHQHNFVQTIRAGGYRPMVFMSHGLAVSLFTATAAMAAMGLYRARIRIGRFSSGFATGYLMFILLIAKSLAAALLYSRLLRYHLSRSPRRLLRRELPRFLRFGI